MAALCIIGLGLILFWISVVAMWETPFAWAFCGKEPELLVRSGPFRIVRHPFYVSYVLGWAGVAVSGTVWWAWLPVVGMTWVYIAAAHLEEQKFLGSTLAGAYERYRQSTGRFLPRVRRSSRDHAPA
jgi:protein-S-isoprenylcysteine O-methyltransferase Ste14